MLKDDGWLSDIPCTGTVPDRFEGDLIWLALDGGPQLHVRERVFLRVNVFSDTPDRAMSLARRVEAVLADGVDGDPVVYCKRSTGPDLLVDGARFDVYSLFELICRPAESE
ncbi:hypothetical protein [Corynebacterium sp.]|uniref:hypothetical protein n=1 Tax=Corynebacterium sp. TaxID=1720 RepID=UPI00292CFAD7|nr:hypothetical protein [Corynebacterium sp.]